MNATLPEGARLALLHWPWGTPTPAAIMALVHEHGGPHHTHADTLQPLFDAGLLAWLVMSVGQSVNGVETSYSERRHLRLTPAGRRAVDAIQSGEA